MRVAYLCSRYPAISHTFVLREVLALRARGVEIDTFTVRRVPEDELLTDTDRREAAATTALLPVGGGRLLATHLGLFLRSSRRYLRALTKAVRLARPDPRSLLWQLFYFAEAGMMARELQRRGIRHVHAHFANVGADVAMLVAALGGDGCSWSFTMHGSTEFYAVQEHRLPQKVQDARFVACISDFCASQLMEATPREHWAKLRTVRCGTDVGEFAAPPDRSPEPPLRILYVGRLVNGKGLPVLLDAMSLLRERGVPAELELVGSGPERDDLAALASASALDGAVTFTGPVGMDRMHERYAAADVFCLPSFAEGVPIVLMEAMASELPVVATRIMGIPELVEDGVSGTLVPAARADLLADALAALASDPDRRQALGAAGRRKVVDEYSIDESARRLEELLQGYP